MRYQANFFIFGAVMLLSACSSTPDKVSTAIPPNKAHFGCWKTKTTQVEGIENIIRLCISSKKSSYAIYYPNLIEDPFDDAMCHADGELVGYDEGGSRLYFMNIGTCSNGRKLSTTMFSCTQKNENQLQCESGKPKDIELETEATFDFVRDDHS